MSTHKYYIESKAIRLQTPMTGGLHYSIGTQTYDQSTGVYSTIYTKYTSLTGTISINLTGLTTEVRIAETSSGPEYGLLMNLIFYFMPGMGYIPLSDPSNTLLEQFMFSSIINIPFLEVFTDPTITTNAAINDITHTKTIYFDNTVNNGFAGITQFTDYYGRTINNSSLDANGNYQILSISPIHFTKAAPFVPGLLGSSTLDSKYLAVFESYPVRKAINNIYLKVKQGESHSIDRILAVGSIDSQTISMTTNPSDIKIEVGSVLILISVNSKTGTGTYPIVTDTGMHYLHLTIEPLQTSGVPRERITVNKPFVNISITLLTTNSNIWVNGQVMHSNLQTAKSYPILLVGYNTNVTIGSTNNIDDLSNTRYLFEYSPNSVTSPKSILGAVQTTLGNITFTMSDSYVVNGANVYSLLYVKPIEAHFVNNGPLFVDIYGNTIAETINSSLIHPAVHYGSALTESFTMYGGTSMPYYDVLNYWGIINNVGITFINSNIVVPVDVPIGSYTYYVTTVLGHTALTIHVINQPNAIEHNMFTYLKFFGVDLQLSDIGLNLGNYIVNGKITTNVSLQIVGTSATYNIVIIPKPEPITINVLLKINDIALYYNIRDLVNIDSRIPDTAINLGTGVEPKSTPLHVNWLTPSNNDPTVTILGYEYITVKVDTVAVTTTAIYAERGKYFNLGSHITPLDSVKSVEVTTDGTTWNIASSSVTLRQPMDVQIVDDKDYAHLRAKVVIRGVTVDITIPIFVVKNILNYYMPPNWDGLSFFRIAGNDQLTIIDQTGQRILVTKELATSVYVGDITVSIDTVNGISVYKLSKLIRPVAIIGIIIGTYDSNLNGKLASVILTPISEIDTGTIYARRITAPGDYYSVKLNLPSGPKYTLTPSNGGASTTFYSTSLAIPISTSSRYQISSPEYLSNPALDIKLRVVNANLMTIYFVNLRTITDYEYRYPKDELTNLNVGTIKPGTNTTVTVSGKVTLTVIVKDITKQAFHELEFVQLPLIKSSLTIYYTTGLTFGGVMPQEGYVYTTVTRSTESTGSTSSIPYTNNTTIATNDQVPFTYGELSGTIKLVKFDGASKHINLVKDVKQTFSATEVKSGNTVLTLPYETGVFKVENVKNVGTGTGKVDITLKVLDGNVPELFLLNNGELILYTFSILPPLEHKDVVSYSNSWKADVACVFNNASGATVYQIGNIISVGSSMRVWYAVSSLDAGYGLTQGDNSIPSFWIHKADANKVVKLALENYPTAETYTSFNSKTISSILSYGTTGSELKPFTEHAIIDTPSATFELKSNSITVTGRTAGKSLICFIALTGGADPTFFELEIETVSLPYKPGSTTNLELLSDVVRTIGDTNYKFENNTSSLTLSSGKNDIKYKYYGLPSNSTWIEAAINVKVFKAPGSFTRTNTMRSGSTLYLDIINDLFGESAGYSIGQTSDIKDDNGDVLLGVSVDNALLKLVAKAITEATVIYTVDLTINVPNTSATLNSTQALVTLTVLVWNPSEVTPAIIYTTPNKETDTTNSAISGNLVNVEFNGSAIKGTSHGMLDWSGWVGNKSEFRIKSSKRGIELYIIYTDSGVYILGVIVVEASVSGTLYVEKGTTTDTTTVDILSLVPTLRDLLIELGLNKKDSIDYTQLSVDNRTDTANALISIGSPTIFNITYNIKVIDPPLFITTSPTFVTPYNKVLKIKSSDVSYNANLSSNDPHATNVSDGIEVFYSSSSSAVLTNTVNCVLTRHDIQSPLLSLTVIAYDPASSKQTSVTTYTRTYTKDLGSTILHYIYNGINYELRQSTNIEVSGLNITFTLSSNTPNVVAQVRTKDGKLHILDITYVEPLPTNAKIYLWQGETKAIKASSVTKVDESSELKLKLANGSSISCYGDNGDLVGTAANESGNVELTASLNPGIWTDLSTILYRSTTDNNILGAFTPYVETVQAPIIKSEEIIAYLGDTLNVNLSTYILSPLTDSTGNKLYVFKDWSVTLNSQTANLATVCRYTNDILTMTPITRQGTYVFTATIHDLRNTGGPLWRDTVFTLTVIVLDRNNTTTKNVAIINTNPLYLKLSDLVGTSSISRVVVNTNSLKLPATFSDISFAIKGTSLINDLVITPHGTNITTSTALLQLANGKLIVLNLTRVDSIKDVNISALEHKGNLFRVLGNIVSSFKFVDNLVTQTGTPGVIYNRSSHTNTADKISISANGDYDVIWHGKLVITVTYNTSSTQTGLTMTLTIGGTDHIKRSIEPLPPPVIDLGASPLSLSVNYNALAEGSSVNVNGAMFMYNSSKLYLTNVSSSFIGTLVQWVTETSSNILVSSLVILLATVLLSEQEYIVTTNSTILFTLPFLPYNISYDTMALSGNNRTFNIYGRNTNDKIGLVTIEGISLTIKVDNITDVTRPIGITQQKDGKTDWHYFTVKVITWTPALVKQVTFGAPTLPPTGLTFTSIGTVDGREVVSIANQMLESIVIFNPNNLIVTNLPTKTFTFYANLVDTNGIYAGTILYSVPYIEQQIFVSDITRISLLALGIITSTVAFGNPATDGITVSGGFINNPNNIPFITILQPKHIKLTVSKLI